MADREFHKLPHSREAEQALLGAILLHPDYLINVSALIETDDFHEVRNRKLYQGILEMFEGRIEIDVISLHEYLKDRGELDACNPVYIDQLFDQIPVTENYMRYAEIVHELAIKRKILQFGIKIIDACNSEESSENILDEVTSEALNISQRKVIKQVKDFQQFIPEYRERYYQRIQNPKAKPLNISTSFTNLNKVINGFREESFNIIAARPSVGKTAFAINLALDAAMQNHPVLFISLEMSTASIINRMLARETDMDSFYIDIGVHAGHYMQLDYGFEKLQAMPMVVMDNALHLSRIINEIRKWKYYYGDLGMVFIDYLQLVRIKGFARDYERITKLSMDLKQVARECKTRIIALAQISREGSDSPSMETVKGSGQIEQDADLFVTMARVDKDDCDKTVLIKFNVVKHRFGITGSFTMNFKRDRCDFLDPSDLQNEDDI